MTESEQRRGGITGRKGLAVGAAVIVLVALVALAVWAASRNDDSRLADRSNGADTAPGTSTGGPSGPSPVPTGTTPATTTDDGGSSDATSMSAGPRIAYRIGSALWIATPDGTDARQVFAEASDVYAVSPDGGMVAARTPVGRLVLVDSESVVVADAGPCEEAPFAWSSRSDLLYFIRRKGADPGSSEVIAIDRKGRAWSVMPGQAVAVSRGGALAAVPPPGAQVGGKGFVWMLHPGGQRLKLATEAEVVAVAIADDRVFYATAGGAGKPPVIRAMGLDGKGAKTLVAGLAEGKPTELTHLVLSPDGEWLAYDEVGDDGYSRANIVATDGSARRGLSIRRDTYVCCWAPDSTRVLFFEGNTFQGERSDLMNVRIDGMGRRVLVRDARP